MKLFAPKNEGGWDMRDPGSWWPNIGSVMTNSGKRVSEDSALTFSAVFAATRIISEAVAGLPLSILEQVDYRTTRKATKHPLWSVLHDIPNPEQDKVTWFDMQTAFLPTWGNAFAEVQRTTSGEIVALWPIHPCRIPLRNITRNSKDPGQIHTIVTGMPGEVVYWVKNDDGSVTPIEASSMLHVPGVMSSNGITGQSIIRWAANSIGIGMATEEHAGALFKNGAVTNMVIKSPKVVGKETADRLRMQWQTVFGGVSNHYKTLLLEDGMEPVPVSMNPEDTQLILARQFSVSEIARWWKVPPHMLGDLSRSTFCLPGDAMVFAESGPKRIDEISVGETVWSRSDDSQWVKATVSASSCTGADEVLRIRAGIRTLRCNARHRVPVRRKVLRPYIGGRGRHVTVDGRKLRAAYEIEWIPAGQIRVGDQLLAAHGFSDSGVRSCPTREECSTEFMESLGMIVGDGFFARNGKRKYKAMFGISHGEHDSYLPHYVNAIESEFLCCDGPYGLRNGGTDVLKAKRRDKNTTVFHSSLAYRELEQIGIAGTAKTKSLPAWIFDLAEDLKLAFLRGYLDSDGTVNKNGHIRYVSVNRKLIEQVRHLCISVGVRVGNMMSSEIDSEFDGVKYHHTLHSVEVTDASDCQRIGTHTDFYNERIARAVASKIGKRNCKMYPFEARQRAKEDGIAYSTIKEISVESSVPVYDLTVEGTHTFVADGVLVHNSNIEQQYLEFVVHSLGPWVQRWEAAMFRQLLTPEEQRKYRFKFNMNAMLRGDSAARSAFYTSLFGMGVVSPNDIRELEDWNPVDGGDQRFIPANNFFPLEKAEEMADAQIKKLKEPAPAPGAPQKSEPDKAAAEAMLVIQKSLIKLEMREPVTKTDVEEAVSGAESRISDATIDFMRQSQESLPAVVAAAMKPFVEAIPHPEPFDPAPILNAVNDVPSRLTQTVIALAAQAAEARNTSESDEVAAKRADLDRKHAEIEEKLTAERLVTDQVLTASLKRGIDALAAREAKGIFGSREQPRTLPEWRTEFYAQLRRHFLHELADLVPAAEACGITLDLQWGADRYSQASISDLKTLDVEALDNNYDAVKAKTDEFVKHLWSERSQVLAVEMISRGRQEKHDAA